MCSVIALSIRVGSMLYVTGSMSTKTGLAPVRATLFAVAAKVKDGTITSSPGPMPRESNARCNAEVPEFTATQFLPSTNSENLASKLATCGP